MRWVILCAILGFLSGCATNKPLADRGLPIAERRDFIIQNGYGIRQEIKDSFLAGHVCKGMAQDLVFQLYGAADREGDAGQLWEYIDRRGNLITGVRFSEGRVSEVLGDPTGGAKAETNQ